MKDKLTASEALYGFAGWLTTRKASVIAGSSHDAAIWAELVDEFCKENNLTEPQDGWEHNLIHPRDFPTKGDNFTTEFKFIPGEVIE